jgi:hypothetical protein
MIAVYAGRRAPLAWREREKSPMWKGWALLALEGFRVIGRRTWSYFLWCLATAIAAGVVYAGFAAISRPLYLHHSVDGPLPLKWLAAMTIPALAILVTPVVCAIYRAVLTPRESFFGYLRLGADELRTAPIMLVIGLVSGLRAWLTSQLPHGWGMAGWAMLAIFFVLMARLQLLGPAIVAEHRLDLRTGWRLGRGHGRGLLLTSLMTGALFLGIFWGFESGWRLLFKTLTGDPMAIGDGKLHALRLLITIRGIVGLLVYTGALVLVIAPGAAAYRKLAEVPDTDPEVFS